MTDHPIKGDKLRHAVIPNALTYAATVGRAQREAVERGSDPIQAILDTGKGKLLFQGTVTGESEWGIKEGFTVGTIHIAGEGAFAHQTSKIWYKNENMVMWIDDKVNLTCPDLICVVEKATGYPITNPNCVEGMEVAVLGFTATSSGRANAHWRFLIPDSLDLIWTASSFRTDRTNLQRTLMI